MAYLGNNLTVQQYAPQVAYFSGNGSTTAFTLPVAVVSAAQIIVIVANVIQNPSSSYSVSGTTLTFTSAPPSGTNNIWVEYTSLQTNTIAPSNGTVSPASLTTGGPSWNSSYAFGVGATPSYGTTGQVLTSQGSSSAPVWANGSATSVSYLIVAGGGSGNDGYINADFIAGGGGGAGGMLTGTQSVTSGTSYTVTVGAGGAYTYTQNTAANGSNSSFTAVGTTAIGGGGGGKQSRQGGNGGSGGGGGGNSSGVGTGTSGQGNNGGDGSGNSTGGGGGGKGSTGGTPTAGSGSASSITGTSVTYATGGTGGSSGSGNGASGASNTGNGGGGSQAGTSQTGGNGGSGIVVIAYPTTNKLAIATGTYTQTNIGGNFIFTFTGSGTITF
jgi:hypothetical protein